MHLSLNHPIIDLNSYSQETNDEKNKSKSELFESISLEIELPSGHHMLMCGIYHPPSLRASSPIWANETSLARTRERAAKPRGAEERRACNHPLQIFICTLPRRREIPLAEK